MFVAKVRLRVDLVWSDSMRVCYRGGTRDKFISTFWLINMTNQGSWMTTNLGWSKRWILPLVHLINLRLLSGRWGWLTRPMYLSFWRNKVFQWWLGCVRIYFGSIYSQSPRNFAVTQIYCSLAVWKRFARSHSKDFVFPNGISIKLVNTLRNFARLSFFLGCQLAARCARADRRIYTPVSSRRNKQTRILAGGFWPAGCRRVMCCGLYGYFRNPPVRSTEWPIISNPPVIWLLNYFEVVFDTTSRLLDRNEI
jgi:hypothetical protein